MRTHDYLLFAEHALDTMARIVSELGDARANTRPDLAGANTPYQLLAHGLGMLDYWVGEFIGERRIERDREAEFLASGSVEALVSQVPAVRRRVRADLDHYVPDKPVILPSRPWMTEGHEHTHEFVLLHTLEELYQHLGHLELTRDTLLAASRSEP